jgi:hypothetical protein
MGPDSHQTITPAQQRGIDRFGEVIAEYARMKGVDGDALQLGAPDLYAGLIADSLHWANREGFDAILAMGEAYRLAEEERAGE